MQRAVGLLVGLMAAPLMAAESTDIDISAGAEYFLWEEFSDSGSLPERRRPSLAVGRWRWTMTASVFPSRTRKTAVTSRRVAGIPWV